MSLLKARITLDIEYELGGTMHGEIRNQLEGLAHAAAGSGMLSGHLEATVETWRCRVQLGDEILDTTP